MRTAIVALLTLAALATTAGPAAADVSNPIIKDYPSTNPPGYGRSCQSNQTYGVYGQYGAWGYYVDGCTVRLYCPSYRRLCSAESRTAIDTFRYGLRVTQNARLRAFDSAGQLIWYRDQSCAGINTCSTTDRVYISGGQSATIQCNGVQEHAKQQAINVCRLNMWYL